MPRKTPRVRAGMKWCPGCRSVRSRDAFTRASRRGDGLASSCRACVGQRYRLKKATRAECKIAGCGRRVRCSGLCHSHHKRWKKLGNPLATPIRRKPTQCAASPDCVKPPRCHGFCAMHYQRFLTYGDPLKTVRAPYGGGHITPQGYRNVFRPGHPNAQSAKGSIHEHRFLMAESLGRPLLEHEEVHHKNGEKADNRIVKGHELHCPSTCCNLELWSKSQPRGQRIEDKLAWALALLRQYKPAALR